MKSVNKLLPLAACLALGAAATGAQAGDVNCPPNLGAVTVDGNIVVTAACTLDGTLVKGNVLLYAGGSLVARDVRIEGNIQAAGANTVDVLRARVTGSIQLDDLVGGTSRITSSDINGNIQLKGNRARLELLDNEVGADLQAFSNSGGVLIADNGIDGNLQCKSNDPPPAGGNNRVSGNAEDQCASLQPESATGPGSGGGGGGGTISGDVNCPPDLGAVTVDGNVLVAAACRLDGTIVKGNVLLYAGGSLLARDARIDGNIQAERANFVDIERTRVIGDIQLDQLVGDLSRVSGSWVGGNIQLNANRSRLEMLTNEVGGDLQAFSNTGGVLITNNGIDGNLQCKSNSPAPVGGNNRVSGNREDQCANLQPEGAAPGGSGSPTPPVGSANPSGSASGSGSSSGGGGATGLFALLALLLALALRASLAAAVPSRRD